MEIVKKEIEKTLDIFKVLELSRTETDKHLKDLENCLLMDMVAEAFAEKGQGMDEANFTQDDVEDFLLDNYSENEIEEIMQRVSRDVVVEYFSKIIKDAPEEKKERINEILLDKFE